MKIQFIDGIFDKEDALELLTDMINVKIRFHERKITQTSFEEDVKYREARIKALQQDLQDLRKSLSAAQATCSIQSEVVLSHQSQLILN